MGTSPQLLDQLSPVLLLQWKALVIILWLALFASHAMWFDWSPCRQILDQVCVTIAVAGTGLFALQRGGWPRDVSVVMLLACSIVFFTRSCFEHHQPWPHSVFRNLASIGIVAGLHGGLLIPSASMMFGHSCIFLVCWFIHADFELQSALHAEGEVWTKSRYVKGTARCSLAVIAYVVNVLCWHLTAW